MKTIITVIVSVVLGVTPLPPVHKPPERTESPAPKIQVSDRKKIETIKPIPQEEITQISESATIKEAAPQPPAPSQSGDNETIAWNYLMSQGFTRNQTAGIMGNLQQEHGFKTDDVPGGLGIAQWTSGRRINLMNRPNYLDINTQLQFLMEELNSTENAALIAIRASPTVEAATMAFSGKFERCGDCRNNQRIVYANQILSRH